VRPGLHGRQAQQHPHAFGAAGFTFLDSLAGDEPM
jgi:hypothetical protein